MQRAVYTTSNLGHYGLAASHYLHFTSPIRRYPDLLVHRLLKAHWADAGRPKAEKAMEEEREMLQRLAEQCSERERAALGAERESDAFFACLYMLPRIDEEFEGTVTSVTDFGLFVRLDDHHIEGLVRAETIAPRWSFDSKALTIAFGKAQGTLGLGASLKIVCVGVRVAERKIDFQLVGTQKKTAESGGAGKAERERTTPRSSLRSSQSLGARTKALMQQASSKKSGSRSKEAPKRGGKGAGATKKGSKGGSAGPKQGGKGPGTAPKSGAGPSKKRRGGRR